MILTPPIRLNSFNFGIKKTLNVSLESVKDLLNIRLMFEEINPTESGLVINKTDIIFVTTGRSNSRSPNIGVN